MHLDNLPPTSTRRAGSPDDDAALPGPGTRLSRNESLPNNLTVVGSGNNVQASGEIAKRIVPIMIEPASANPEARTDFQHPDIRAHVRRRRRTVLECLLGLVENWLAAGRPTCTDRLGGFESWSEAVGGHPASQRPACVVARTKASGAMWPIRTAPRGDVRRGWMKLRRGRSDRARTDDPRRAERPVRLRVRRNGIAARGRVRQVADAPCQRAHRQCALPAQAGGGLRLEETMGLENVLRRLTTQTHRLQGFCAIRRTPRAVAPCRGCRGRAGFSKTSASPSRVSAEGANVKQRLQRFLTAFACDGARGGRARAPRTERIDAVPLQPLQPLHCPSRSRC